MKKILAAAVTVACMGTAAMASTVTVSFETDDLGFIDVPSGGDGGATPHSVGFANFGVTADTFTLSGTDVNLDDRNVYITQNNEGLGVRNGRYDNSGNIDGFGLNDILIFEFDREVLLQNIIFEEVDSFKGVPFEDFVFYVPSASPEGQEYDILDLPFLDTDGDEGFFDFGGRHVTTFGIGAKGKFDSFRVSKLTVSEVPLPASALLLLAGVGGLAAMRRKKS